MLNPEKLVKTSKLLRLKAQEFLSSPKYSNNLVDIVKRLDSGIDHIPCLLSLELIFTTLLKEGQMLVEIVPLNPAERTPEYQYKEWLRKIYEECFVKALSFCEGGSTKIQIQGKEFIDYY